jgi:hypothetical protein
MAVTVAMRTQVSQLYVSLFGRAPDSEGLGFWVAALGGGVTMAQVAESMYNTAPARAYYPAFATNQEIVATFYLNVLGRPADAEGLAFWTKELAAAPSKGAFFTKLLNNVVNYTGTDADGLKSQALFLNKVTVAQYYGENNGSIAESTAALNGVTHEAATVVAAKAIIDGEVGGETYALTSATDKIDISTAIGIDTIRGILYQPLSSNGESTFTLADEVRGNDKTVLQLLVAEGSDDIDAPYVTVAGIDKLDVIAAQTGPDGAGLNIDASTYGTDISMITLGGKDDFDLQVLNLDVTGQLDIEIAADSDNANVDAEGVIDGLNFDISATNNSADGVGVDVVAGVAGIDITLGEDDDLQMTLSNTASEVASAVVGDIEVGDINVVIGDDASMSLSLYNYAYTSGKGSATAGNITVGDVKIALGDTATAYFTISNTAYANNGSAQVGSITVGDIAFTAGSYVGYYDEESYINIDNSAISTKGNAVAGDVTIGNVDFTVAQSQSDTAPLLYVSNYARADETGNASVGNLTMGHFSYVADDDFYSAFNEISIVAYADKGNATVGQTSVGDVSLTLGNEASYYLSYSLWIDASVSKTGNATVADVAVGDITLNAGNAASVFAYVTVTAETVKGAATVGDVVIGNVKAEVGVTAEAEFDLVLNATGTTATIGDITVGNIDMYGQADAYVTAAIDASSTGSIGNVTLGNADMKVDSAQDNARIQYSVDLAAGTDIGDVKIGDLTMTLGSYATLEEFQVDVSASTGDLASFAVGNITIDMGINAFDTNSDDPSDNNDDEWDIYAGNDIGNVKFGDITVNAEKNAALDTWTVDVLADAGAIGNISIGDQTVTAGVEATNDVRLIFTADDGIGNITAGDVSVSSVKTGDIYVYNNYNASFDIGNITYGDISVAANGTAAFASFSLGAYANTDSIGVVNVGDIDVTVSGSDADAHAYFWLDDNEDGVTVGDMTVGDITVNLSNSNTADAISGLNDNAYAGVEIDTNGNLTVGNITVTAGDVTEDLLDSHTVSSYFEFITASSLNVGNITVIGGQKNANGVMDNLGTLFNYDASGGFMDLAEEGDGSITVGNIDYRGYEAEATIDLTAFPSAIKGAAFIYAAQDDTTIYDNRSKNVITLGAGTDSVHLNAETATTDKTSASAIDEIINFTSLKDKLFVESTDTDYDDFDFVSSNAGTYANFLTAAGEAMSSYADTEIYARVLDGSVYVAFDKDSSGTVDFVVKLTGITTLDVSDITIVDNL